LRRCWLKEDGNASTYSHTAFQLSEAVNNASTAAGDGIWMDAGLVQRDAEAAEQFRHHVSARARHAMAELVRCRRLLLRFVPADCKPLLTAHMADPQSAYDDPHTPLHSKVPPLQSVLKKLIEREKKIPKSNIPLTKRNLEEFHNPDFTDVHNAFLAFRPGRKVSVHEWLQLLP
jgi:hypothetical protein